VLSEEHRRDARLPACEPLAKRSALQSENLTGAWIREILELPGCFSQDRLVYRARRPGMLSLRAIALSVPSVPDADRRFAQ
jgi:hypothetical protein